jgi:hypothetical protein
MQQPHRRPNCGHPQPPGDRNLGRNGNSPRHHRRTPTNLNQPPDTTLLPKHTHRATNLSNCSLPACRHTTKHSRTPRQHPQPQPLASFQTAIDLKDGQPSYLVVKTKSWWFDNTNHQSSPQMPDAVHHSNAFFEFTERCPGWYWHRPKNPTRLPPDFVHGKPFCVVPPHLLTHRAPITANITGIKPHQKADVNGKPDQAL